jgi:hypothetical protein
MINGNGPVRSKGFSERCWIKSCLTPIYTVERFVKLKGTHAQDFTYSSFFTFFWHHSIKDKAEIQNLKKFVKLRVKSP